MEDKRSLTSEEISAIVDSFDPIDVEEMEVMAKLPSSKRWLMGYRKSEVICADLRYKLMEDFPELSLSEINMKVMYPAGNIDDLIKQIGSVDFS